MHLLTQQSYFKDDQKIEALETGYQYEFTTSWPVVAEWKRRDSPIKGE